MVWNDPWPDVTQSVKANGPTGVQNTNFIDTSMKRDHFWNQEGSNDGRHRQMQMIKTETGGNPSDISLAGGIDGGIYIKETSNGLAQGFYRTDDTDPNQTYQFIPGFLTGTVTFVAFDTQVNITVVPDNTYGQIIIFKQPVGGNSPFSVQSGWFRVVNDICQAWSSATIFSGHSNPLVLVKFANFTGAGGDLNIKGSVQKNSSFPGQSGALGTYEYRITYWDI